MHNRLDYVANVEEILTGRTDVELDVYLPHERSAFVNHFGFWRQWRPSGVAAAESPRDPRRAPFIARPPNPAIIGEPYPAAIVIRCPTKIFVRDPRPAEISVGPVSIGVRPPRRIARDIGLPAVAIISNLDPASAVQIIVKEIY